MKIVILGASGACGRALLKDAVGRGHSIVAVGRASSEIPDSAGVEVRRGDLCDVAFLTEALEGCEVVLSALGFRMPGIAPWHKPSDPTFLEETAAAQVAAAQAAGVGRLMAISSGGAGDSWDIMPGAFRTFVRCSALRHILPRLSAMEAVYLGAQLDVCVVRPSGLTNGPATGEAVVTSGYSGQPQISRADVASWMLDALETAPFVHRAPLITVTGAIPAP